MKVTKEQTIKNQNGSVEVVYFGVKDPKYIDITADKTLKVALEDIHSDITELDETLKKKIEDADSALSGRIDKHDTTLSQYDTRITTNANNISTLSGDYTALSNTVSSHGTSIESITGILTTLGQTVSAMGISVEELQRQLAALTERVAALEPPIEEPEDPDESGETV